MCINKNKMKANGKLKWKKIYNIIVSEKRIVYNGGGVNNYNGKLSYN